MRFFSFFIYKCKHNSIYFKISDIREANSDGRWVKEDDVDESTLQIYRNQHQLILRSQKLMQTPFNPWGLNKMVTNFRLRTDGTMKMY